MRQLNSTTREELYLILPLLKSRDDNETIARVYTFLSENRDYRSIRLQSLKNVDDYFYISFLYEGHSDYYPFTLELYLAEDKNNTLLLAGSIVQAVHPIFEEIIKDKILPQFLETTGIRDYYARNF